MLNEWDLQRTFGDTNFVRFYMNRSDIKDYKRYISLLQQIWDNKEIVIVEGDRSRLGIGNNLFDNASSIRRILCPATSAFDKYEHILNTVKTISNNNLILIALGPTATVLAYDLHQCGYQAVDIGHIDIEYEWYLMKVRQKVAVPNKYVNEVHEGRIDSNNLDDDLYQSQIIARI
jgi:glycosyltransferase family protein